jgi:TetR/AcrR family transcriptional regulator, regulator of mycofactocin system
MDERKNLDVQPLVLDLKAKRSEMMTSALEGVALRLFDQRGFANVTVEEIASEARISVRTFYRYFAAKEEVLQLRIERRSVALQAALAARPADEPPLRSLRLALDEEFAAVDETLLRRWIAVTSNTPSVLKGVMGAIQLRIHPVIAEFLGSRLGVPGSDLVPTMLAAAVNGVIQAAHTQWFVQGGDLAATISEGVGVLEKGINIDPDTWSINDSP